MTEGGDIYKQLSNRIPKMELRINKMILSMLKRKPHGILPGARGSVVVKALRYKPEGCGIAPQ
jgi:hypothetical protein